jgi:hypothetical protein
MAARSAAVPAAARWREPGLEIFRAARSTSDAGDNAAHAQWRELMFQRVERRSDFIRELDRRPLDITRSDYALPWRRRPSRA